MILVPLTVEDFAERFVDWLLKLIVLLIELLLIVFVFLVDLQACLFDIW